VQEKNETRTAMKTFLALIKLSICSIYIVVKFTRKTKNRIRS